MAARGYAAEVARCDRAATSDRLRTRPASPRRRAACVGELRQEDISLDDARAARSRRSPSRSRRPQASSTSTGATSTAAPTATTATDALGRGRRVAFDGAELLVYGLWRLGAHGRRLLERLAERVPVTVFLPTVGGDPDDAHVELRDWLTDAGASERAAGRRGAAKATALAHLQARLVLRRSARPTPDGTVQLVSAPDPLTEVREAARTCLDWAREGILFREMAITYRDAGIYRPVVEAVFTEAGIPVYLDDGPSIAERPLGRRILALIDLIDSPLRRRDVLAFLTDGWLPEGDARALRRRRRVALGVGDSPRRHRRGARSVALAPRLADRARAREPRREGAPEWLAERVVEAESLLRFIEDFARLLAAHPERGHLGGVPRLVPAARRGRRPGSRARCSATSTSSRSSTSSTGPVDYARFLDTVRAEIRALKAGDLDGGNQGALGLRGVSVLDVNALRHLRFRAVAVLGLTERSFPPPPRQDPLLLDDERDALNEAGGLTLPLRARGADQEPLQFAVAVERRARAAVPLDPPRGGGGRSRAAALVVLPRGRLGARGSAARRERDRHARRRLLPLPARGSHRRRRSRPRAHRAGARHVAARDTTRRSAPPCCTRSRPSRCAPTRTAARAGRRAALTRVRRHRSTRSRGDRGARRTGSRPPLHSARRPSRPTRSARTASSSSACSGSSRSRSPRRSSSSMRSRADP